MADRNNPSYAYIIFFYLLIKLILAIQKRHLKAIVNTSLKTLV